MAQHLQILCHFSFLGIMKSISNEDLKCLVAYQNESGAMTLRADVRAETIWATQKQRAEIFHVGIPAINKHIKNILNEDELDSLG
ncbi:hypothetical protein H6776_00170 [Candidatus Nomurabacteria bacterium]|nr:hypothetical protein [Candidatus Nomurabacteria bacterium]